MNTPTTVNMAMSLGLGVIGVTSVVDCDTNIYLRSTKLPRTSEREMETDGETVSVGEYGGAVMELGQGYELEQTCDAGLSLATNVRGARCKSVVDGAVIGTGLRYEQDRICDKEPRYLATNVRGHVAEYVDESMRGPWKWD